MISGLHSCKPGNDPQVGQVKTFTVQQMTGKSGKPYTKIKSAGAAEGGTPYKILSAKPTGYTDPHQNISFNLEIEPANGAAIPVAQQQHYTAPRGNGSDDRSNRIERQHSQEMAIRYATLKGLNMIDTEDLRNLIDWFQRDVGRMPGEASKPGPVQDVQSPEEDPF